MIRLPTRSQSAFTLVEVILAIGLATGLLLLVFTFYHQAAEMRRQLLREAEQVSTMRLVLDRLAGDLRGVQPKPSSGSEFTGDSNSMSFVKLACTSLPLYASAGTNEPTDLMRVSLTTLFTTNENRVVVSGLDRSETSLTPPAASPSSSTNSDELALWLPEQTNTVTATEPFADMVRFVRFRYWDGAAWQLAWTNPAPPPGVEIVLSTVASAEDAEPDAYPPEALRRVVALPGGVRHSAPDLGAETNASVDIP